MKSISQKEMMIEFNIYAHNMEKMKTQTSMCKKFKIIALTYVSSLLKLLEQWSIFLTTSSFWGAIPPFIFGVVASRINSSTSREFVNSMPSCGRAWFLEWIVDSVFHKGILEANHQHSKQSTPMHLIPLLNFSSMEILLSRVTISPLPILLRKFVAHCQYQLLWVWKQRMETV